MVSTSAWRTFDTLNRAEEDGTNKSWLYIDTVNIENNTTWYQEFKFSGSTAKLDWVAGASWFKERARQSSVVNLTSDSVNTAALSQYGLPLFSMLQGAADFYGIPVQLFGNPWQESYDNTLDSEAYAAFGDVIWRATDKLNLTFGLRYTRDTKDFTWYNGYHRADALNAALATLEQYGVLPVQVPCSMLGLCAPDDMTLVDIDAQFLAGFDLAFSDPVSFMNKGVLNRDGNSWSDWSPRFVVDFHIDDKTMVFASLAKGYKAGGYNAFSPGAAFDNEEVWNFEAGIKKTLADDRLQFDASAYKYKYDNRQAVRLDTTQAIPRYVISSSDLTAWGAEFSARWKPTRALSLDANLAWIDSTYDNFVTVEGDDLGGQPTGEPWLSYSLGGSYLFELGDAGDVSISLRHAFRGASRCNSSSNTQGDCGRYPAFRIGESQNRTDLYLQWQSRDEQLSVAGYVNNLFDHRYVHGLSSYGTTVFGTVGTTISAPRMYGVEVQYQF